MKRAILFPIAVLTAVVCMSGCAEKGGGEGEAVIQHYPLDDVDDIITRSSVELDTEITSDGNGSIRVTAGGPALVRLFEMGDIDIENARLVYRAKLRTENVEGRVYLEMYCRLPGMGEYFSRGIESPLSGTNEWVTEEIPFYFKKAMNPDNVKLNLVIDGRGTVWIDDIRVLRAPL
jgi:hypothetical protein